MVLPRQNSNNASKIWCSHTKLLKPDVLVFDLQKNGNQSDAYGYMLHTMGLIGKAIQLKPEKLMNAD